MAERTTDHVEETCEKDFLGFDGDGSGFDLGKVQDVADEIQEVRTCSVNRARTLDLLAGEIPIRVVSQLLAQDQNAVERRPELMGHISQELGFVLGGKSQFLGLPLELASRLLDLLVLALNLRI